MTLEYRPGGPTLEQQFLKRIPDLSGRNTMNQGAPETAAEARPDSMQPRPHLALSDHDLAEGIVDLDEAVDNLLRLRDEKRIELAHRITESGGTMLDDPDFTIELKPGPVSYDVGELVPLKEKLSEENLAKCFTSADDVRKRMKVSDKWDGQQLNALAGRYGDVARIVERARIPGRAKVVVERKKEART